MNEKMVKKEELLSMLAEIYNQLEELESVIESNMSSVQENMQMDFSNRVASCDQSLSALEFKFDGSLEPDSSDTERSHSNLPRSMKLELGF